METKNEYYARMGKQIKGLSERASGWGQLLAGHLLDYPITEAYHTGVDRLLNRDITDGPQALELAFATLSQYENSEGTIKQLMESAVIVAGEKAVELLKRLVQQCPITEISGSANETLNAYSKGEFKEITNRALNGSDGAVKKRLDDLVCERTKSW